MIIEDHISIQHVEILLFFSKYTEWSNLSNVGIMKDCVLKYIYEEL